MVIDIYIYDIDAILTVDVDELTPILAAALALLGFDYDYSKCHYPPLYSEDEAVEIILGYKEAFLDE